MSGCTELTCPHHGEENRRLRESVERGLADSAAGRVHDLGSLARYADAEGSE